MGNGTEISTITMSNVMDIPYQSAEVGKLYTALAKAKLEFKPVEKTATNPFFHSKYAPLNELINATRDALAKNGLVIVHTVIPTELGQVLISTLQHDAGQFQNTFSVMDNFLVEEVVLDEDGNPKKQSANTRLQTYGKVKTYLRRYAMMDLLDLAGEDDHDGNAMPAKSAKPGKKQPAKKKQETEGGVWRGRCFKLAGELGLTDGAMRDDIHKVLGIEVKTRSGVTEAQWEEYHKSLKERVDLKQEEEREPGTERQLDLIRLLNKGEMAVNDLRRIVKANVNKLEDLSSDQANTVIETLGGDVKDAMPPDEDEGIPFDSTIPATEEQFAEIEKYEDQPIANIQKVIDRKIENLNELSTTEADVFIAWLRKNGTLKQTEAASTTS